MINLLREPGDMEYLTVSCEPLDNVAKRVPGPGSAIDWLQVDVEGFEFWVLWNMVGKLRPKFVNYEQVVMRAVNPTVEYDLQRQLALAGYYTFGDNARNMRAVRMDVLENATRSACKL